MIFFGLAAGGFTVLAVVLVGKRVVVQKKFVIMVFFVLGYMIAKYVKVYHRIEFSRRPQCPFESSWVDNQGVQKSKTKYPDEVDGAPGLRTYRAGM